MANLNSNFHYQTLKETFFLQKCVQNVHGFAMCSNIEGVLPVAVEAKMG